MKKIIGIIVLVTAGTGMFFAGRGCRQDYGGRVETSSRIDTVIVRDTLRDTVLVPVERFIVRIDTVWMQTERDIAQVADSGRAADSARVVVPVERKVYATDDYRAVVEGFRPELVEIELYRKTALITKETTRTYPRRRWGIGVQAGYGFSPKGAVPHIGIGIQYSVITW